MTATAGRAGAASLAALLVVAVVQQATTSDVVADLLSLVSPAVCSLVLLAAVRAGRFSRPWPWLCLAASAGCVALGNTVWLRHTLVGEAPFPGWGDVLYLSSYPPLLAAVVGLGRLGRRRLPAVLDAAVLAVAVALPLWFLVGAPALVSGDALSRLVGLAYPAADLLVLALLTVLLLGPTAARGGQRLLALSVLVVVVGDTAFAVLTASSAYTAGSPVDLLWQLQYFVWTLLALSPLGLQLDAEPVPDPPVHRRGRSVAVLLALVVPGPVALALAGGLAGQGSALVVCAGTSLIALLAVVRLGLLADLLSDDLVERSADAARARSVAATDTVLLVAVGRVEVHRAALRAALAVVGDGVRPCVVGLAVGVPGLLEVVAVDARDVLLERHAEVDLPALLRQAEVDLSAGGAFEGPVGPHGPDADRLLVLALTASSGRPLGALLVSARAADLTAARAALHGVAERVCLAMEAVCSRERADLARTPVTGRVPAPRPPLGRVAELSGAIARGELVPHYQPIVDLVTRRPVGFEALVRWEHPVRGLLSPAAFLPALEETGLLSQLDGLLLRRACRDAVGWEPHPDGPYVSVNLSTSMLTSPATPSLVGEALAASGLPPWRLLLEVTETSALTDPTAVAAVLDRLRRMQVRIAFDDFGTGYSALSWLQQLPLDVVKVDKSFVDRLPVPPGERPVVEAVVRLAQTLGLDVVAEGVERPEQADALRAMGVRSGQGWLFSRAVPSSQVPPLLCPAAVPQDAGARVPVP